MSDGAITVTPLATHRNATPYPFCPGCGHSTILDHLNNALLKLKLDPRRVVLVTDIGCSGLSDEYFITSAFHGLHGRSITYASGIKLARPDLSVVVIMGDGGTGIGGTHLVNAARRNIGITVLVFNNFNFGMTGGQHSTTTPVGGVTTTTPGGNLERPLDICATVAVNGAGFVYRGTSFDDDLADRIAEGIRHPGFSLFDIWEPCTAYYVPSNKMNRKALFDTLQELGLASGVIRKDDAPEYAAAYREACAPERGKPLMTPRGLEPRFDARLDRPFRVVVAGSAGGKVRSAVRLVGEAAILSGLWAAQRDDYPITVKTGHSVSELLLSPSEMHYTGVVRPDVLVVLTAEGRKKTDRYVAHMTAEDQVFVLPGLTPVTAPAPPILLDPVQAGVRASPTSLALVVLAAVVRRLGLLPADALLAAAKLGSAAYAQENTRAVEAGLALAALPGGGS